MKSSLADDLFSNGQQSYAAKAPKDRCFLGQDGLPSILGQFHHPFGTTLDPYKHDLSVCGQVVNVTF